MEHCYVIEYQDILHGPGKHDSVGWNCVHSVQCTGRSLEGRGFHSWTFQVPMLGV